MATKNPACSNGWARPYMGQGPTGNIAVAFRAHCGCGWTRDSFPSKTKALAAQKEHRFPVRDQLQPPT